MLSKGITEKKLITNRLNRISGQINGIKKMIDNDTYCNDVLIQLKAVESSIQSLLRLLLMQDRLWLILQREQKLMQERL